MAAQRRDLLTIGATGGLLLAQAPVAAQPPDPPALPRQHVIRTPDGLALAAWEAGNPRGRPILFLHGYCQAALSWDRQLRDAGLMQEFRLVALDLRGHSMSDKPLDAAAYKTGRLWADDLQAVLEQLDLRRPTVVGWSYAGRMMGDYLAAHGAAALGALNFVGAVTSTADPAGFGRGGRFGPQLTSADTATAIRGTASFLRECFELQPSTGDFETMLAFNMMCPRHARIAMTGRPAQFDEALRALDIPVLVTHGGRDKLVTMVMAEGTARRASGARLSVYEEAGHAPFWEDAPRFNRELAELARGARG